MSKPSSPKTSSFPNFFGFRSDKYKPSETASSITDIGDMSDVYQNSEESVPLFNRSSEEGNNPEMMEPEENLNQLLPGAGGKFYNNSRLAFLNPFSKKNESRLTTDNLKNRKRTEMVANPAFERDEDTMSTSTDSDDYLDDPTRRFTSSAPSIISVEENESVDESSKSSSYNTRSFKMPSLTMPKMPSLTMPKMPTLTLWGSKAKAEDSTHDVTDDVFSGLGEEEKTKARNVVSAAASNSEAIYDVVKIDGGRAQAFEKVKESFAGKADFSEMKTVLNSEEIKQMCGKDTSFAIFANTALGVIDDPRSSDDAAKKGFVTDLFKFFEYLSSPTPSPNKEQECVKIATANAQLAVLPNFGDLMQKSFSDIFAEPVRIAQENAEKAAKEAEELSKSAHGLTEADLDGDHKSKKKKLETSLQDIDGKTLAVSGISGVAAIALMVALPGIGIIPGIALLGYAAYNLSSKDKGSEPSEFANPLEGMSPEERKAVMEATKVLGSAAKKTKTTTGAVEPVITSPTALPSDPARGGSSSVLEV